MSAQRFACPRCSAPVIASAARAVVAICEHVVNCAHFSELERAEVRQALERIAERIGSQCQA